MKKHDTRKDNVLAKVFNAARGSSMSMSIRSWLNLFTVTPVSVLEKKDMGALYATMNVSEGKK